MQQGEIGPLAFFILVYITFQCSLTSRSHVILFPLPLHDIFLLNLVIALFMAILITSRYCNLIFKLYQTKDLSLCLYLSCVPVQYRFPMCLESKWLQTPIKMPVSAQSYACRRFHIYYYHQLIDIIISLMLWNLYGFILSLPVAWYCWLQFTSCPHR